MRTRQRLVLLVPTSADINTVLDPQIHDVVSASFYQMRTIAKVCNFLYPKDYEKVVQTFISSRLDYCNALFSGIGQASLHKLVFPNGAARLLTRTKKFDIAGTSKEADLQMEVDMDWAHTAKGKWQHHEAGFGMESVG